MEGRRDPNNWITIVLTQWAQVGLMGIIYVFIPESPCEYSLSGWPSQLMGFRVAREKWHEGEGNENPTTTIRPDP